MVKLKLTPNSTMGLLQVTPNDTITREKEIEVSVAFAINRIGDPNFLFTFEECDRLELEKADDKLLASAGSGLGKEDLTAEMLVKTLLPPKVVPKKSTSKTTKKATATKSSSKSSLSE